MAVPTRVYFEFWQQEHLLARLLGYRSCGLRMRLNINWIYKQSCSGIRVGSYTAADVFQSYLGWCRDCVGADNGWVRLLDGNLRKDRAV